MRQHTKATHLVERIPDPQTVRDRLADNLRETRILRQLLKLSERMARERENRQGVANGR